MIRTSDTAGFRAGLIRAVAIGMLAGLAFIGAGAVLVVCAFGWRIVPSI